MGKLTRKDLLAKIEVLEHRLTVLELKQPIIFINPAPAFPHWDTQPVPVYPQPWYGPTCLRPEVLCIGTTAVAQ